MKRNWMSLLLSLSLVFCTVVTAHAETFYGDSGWQVAFSENKKMESNFKTSDLDEAVSGLQPGDNIIFTLSLSNQNSSTTDWYMTNEVLYSLEDRSTNSGTSGGAYTYILTYTDKDGTVTTLFSSDTVGGETVSVAGEGLHEATNALSDYFYLDTLNKGESGTISLEVALDGETQGNDYQDTLADLQMNFAVELSTSTTNGGGTNTPSSSTTENSSNPSGNNTNSSDSSIVRTGDDTNYVLIFAIMGISGILLLILGIYSIKRRKQEEKGED